MSNVKIDPDAFKKYIEEGKTPEEALELARVTSQTSEVKRMSRLMTLSRKVIDNVKDESRVQHILDEIGGEIKGNPVPKAVPVAKSKGEGKFIRWDFVGDESPDAEDIKQAIEESERLLAE